MSDSFTGFSRNDFVAFKESKRENKRFNSERKIVWEKMKKLQLNLESELRRQSFPLKGKISQYWINYTKRHVNGIWLAYTDIAPYYKVCQLNCGIYKDGFFAGIEINPKASEQLQNVLQYLNKNKREFISIVNELNPAYFYLRYGNWVANSSNIKVSDIDALIKEMHKERAWFELGEWYSKQEKFLSNGEFLSRIPKIFETLFPLYLVFTGRRPTGHSTKDKLLRLKDVPKKVLPKIEKAIASEIDDLTNDQLDELIADIDKRNKVAPPQKLGNNSQSYRRNPVLSVALKKKHGDKCQVCGVNLKVDRGFFCDTHHVKPLSKGGIDVSENILVLCPNHHRFFDRSKYEIISENASLLVIKFGTETLKIFR